MHIGLIGGIGPAATDFYYRRLISTLGAKDVAFDITIAHANAPTSLQNITENNVDEQLAVYTRLTDRLAVAGAEMVVVTSIAGHFCIEPFKEVSSLPVINMIEETNKQVANMGFDKIGILGTRTVMESRFYGGITSAEIIPPQGDQLDQVHKAYVTMAASGEVNDQQRGVFAEACEMLLEGQGAEAIMLGGTDLTLVYDQNHVEFPVIDCAAIHCDAVVEFGSR
ncbi:MAG: amino acid racemase [Pseudomonadota bacterium]